MSAIHIYHIEGRHKGLVLVRNAYSRYGDRPLSRLRVVGMAAPKDGCLRSACPFNRRRTKTCGTTRFTGMPARIPWPLLTVWGQAGRVGFMLDHVVGDSREA